MAISEGPIRVPEGKDYRSLDMVIYFATTFRYGCTGMPEKAMLTTVYIFYYNLLHEMYFCSLSGKVILDES